MPQSLTPLRWDYQNGFFFFFNKLDKSLDLQNAVITEQELKIKKLEQSIDEMEPKKRAKMAVDLNDQFAKIHNDIQTRKPFHHVLDPSGTSETLKKKKKILLKIFVMNGSFRSHWSKIDLNSCFVVV